jgi:RHS repeat-associated protein
MVCTNNHTVLPLLFRNVADNANTENIFSFSFSFGYGYGYGYDFSFDYKNGFTGNATEELTSKFTSEIACSGLINMNARLYDPVVGRFLSPDTLVPDPTSSQDYNRYSYVRNNPLKYTDPTGMTYINKIYADNDRIHANTYWELPCHHFYGGGGIHYGNGGFGSLGSWGNTYGWINGIGQNGSDKAMAEVMRVFGGFFASAPTSDGWTWSGPLGGATDVDFSKLRYSHKTGLIYGCFGTVYWKGEHGIHRVGFSFDPNALPKSGLWWRDPWGWLDKSSDFWDKYGPLINSAVDIAGEFLPRMKGLGIPLTVASAGNDYYRWRTGQISTVRYVYRTTGTAAAIGANRYVPGLGALVGLSVYSMERTFDYFSDFFKFIHSETLNFFHTDNLIPRYWHK